MGQFDWTPEVYLERIRAEIPGYDDLQDQAVAAIPFTPERVLELGMGTGETTRRLIEAHPEAWVIGLDSSPDMVFRARKSYDDVQLARMEDPLPDGPWDLVISVLSVNQLDDEQRQNLCRQVKRQARSLVIGDVFVGNQLSDLVSGAKGRSSGSKVTWPSSARPTRPPAATIPRRWPSRRRELPARDATSGAPTTRPARPASTAARAVIARGCRIASAPPVGPTPGVRSSLSKSPTPRRRPPTPSSRGT